MHQSDRVQLLLPRGAGLEDIISWFTMFGGQIEESATLQSTGESSREKYVVRYASFQFVYLETELTEQAVREQNSSSRKGVTIVLEMAEYVRLVVRYQGVEAVNNLPLSFVLKAPFDYPLEFTAYVN